MGTEVRDTGISAVGALPWGTHLCHFYETKEDLLDILIPYFKVGLEGNEFCIWAVLDPLNEEEATNALRRAVSDADLRLAAGDIQVVSYSQWYLKDNTFSVDRLISTLRAKLTQALARGYAGIRINGNEAWPTKTEWKEFSQYEQELDRLISHERALVLCSYPLDAISAARTFDVARIHQFAIARRRGHWELVETPELRQAKEEIEREATRRLLLERVLSAQEEERRRIARELHDEAGQLLTSLLVGLRSLEDSRNIADAKAKGHRLREITAQAIDEVGRLARGLHPTVLDDHGLSVALSRYVAEYIKTHNISVDLKLNGLDSGNLPSAVQIGLYRIVQEALTNVARHSGAKKVSIKSACSATALEVAIVDDGCGFDAKAVAVSSHRLGIQSMRERAAMLGGTVSFASQRRGTKVLVRVPLASQDLQPRMERGST